MKTSLIPMMCGAVLMASVAFADHHADKPCPAMLDKHGHRMPMPKDCMDMCRKMHKPMPGMHDMRGMAMGMDMPVKGVANASTKALNDANMTMHKGMDITYTGDADIDFLRGMIAHHQGAVDMAQAQLQYGKDAQVRRLAMDIVRAQNLEIAWMTKWLAQLEAKGAKVSSDTPRQGKFVDAHWMGDTWMNER